MNCDVDEGMISTYRRDGYLAIDRLLDAEELAAWRTKIDAALADRGGRKLPEPGSPAVNYTGAFEQTMNLWMDQPGILGLVGDQRIGRMLARLAGVAGLRIWHDQALCKQPHSHPTCWHKDNQFWSFTDPASISLWIALDDATVENGAMWYFPGSHAATTTTKISMGFGLPTADVFKECPDYRPDAVCVPRRAGDAVVHNGWTVHAAGANYTSKWRRAMTCAYMPDGCRYNGTANILPARITETLAIGAPLDDDRQNPVVWREREPAHA